MRKKLKNDSSFKEDPKIEGIWKNILMPPLTPLTTSFYPQETKNANNPRNYSMGVEKGKRDGLLEFLQDIVAQRLAYVSYS